MDRASALNQRLCTQGLSGDGFATQASAVAFLGAVQSQDFGNARWALGQRCRSVADADVRRAFDEGEILRTHILRPTWHFVSPVDIRWMLGLTAPHVKRLNRTYYRKHGLDERLLVRSKTSIIEAIAARGPLTRPEIRDLLTLDGVVMASIPLGLVVMDAELDALICSGPMRGKQHTYALLDDRATGTLLQQDEALAHLSKRFFCGHGPATDRDYSRWSGLTLTQARRGLASVEGGLEQIEIDGLAHWFDPASVIECTIEDRAFLLSEFDECYLTYPQVNFPDLPVATTAEKWTDTYFRPLIINGHRAGTWRRTLSRKFVSVEVNLFASLDPQQRGLLEAEVDRLGSFLGLPATLAVSG